MHAYNFCNCSMVLNYFHLFSFNSFFSLLFSLVNFNGHMFKFTNFFLSCVQQTTDFKVLME